MSNSKYVEYTRLSPNCSPRTAPISKITIHHMAVVNGSLEGVGARFADPNSYASANYGIDSDGKVALYVPEEKRAWTSSNSENDNMAVTIEVANSAGNPDWPVSAKAYAKLIDLCVDICQRNGIEKLVYTGDKTGNLTMHCFFSQTCCPGPYLKSRFPQIAEAVNKRLGKPAAPEPTTLYRVQLGAFAVKENAERLLDQLRAVASDAFIVNVDGLYKVQVGAFSVKANAERLAEKLKNQGYQTYITTASGKVSPVITTIDEGDTVRLKEDAKDYDGHSLAGFVYKRNHVVKQLDGDRAVLTYGGEIVCAARVFDLILVKKG